MTIRDIASKIDHSILNPTFTTEGFYKELDVAKAYNCASVCVRPCDVKRAAEYLAGTQVQVGTVIGFPHGTTTTAAKLAEAQEAMDNGAVELDMVLNIGRLLAGEYDEVEADIKAIVDAGHARGALIKVIFENCYLSDEQKIAACRICDRVGADYVKTSTGYAKSGATVEDIRLMKANVSDRVKVKAASGIRSLESFELFAAEGVSRVGATATIKIIEEARAKGYPEV